MARPTDQEMTAMKEQIFTQSSSETEAQHTMQGHMEKHLGRSGGRKSEGEAWANAYMMAFMRQGEKADQVWNWLVGII